MITRLPYHEVINIMFQLVCFLTVLHGSESEGELMINQKRKKLHAALV